jgi:hypothetical protein
MPTESKTSEPEIIGHVIHLGDGHSVAIYKRDGVCWIADFQWGVGRLTDAASWFRFHAGVLRHSHGRRAAALDTMAPITPELVERIERLHRPAKTGKAQVEISTSDAGPKPAPQVAPSDWRQGAYS